MTTILPTTLAILMAIAVYFLRLKLANRPSSVKKIILPPFFMSTGALMFLFPPFRVAPLQIIEALLVGFIFSIFLIKTSNFEIKNDQIFMKRSKAFLFILLGLLAIRIVAKIVFSAHFDIGELAGMFWILAFGMIVPWRIAMLLKYKKLERSLHNVSH
ncbi:hypothetical protein BC6307_12100 [Sutcliffiella cohnii]|uniref:Cytochrome c biogenesis protein CcdC n=1 Tax=Sutcliffiella cohnii TaxID=33932 RepID=A0A223KR57_9BACI|nr:cytochrome c biogenesis protein CcdC [Sutcliffiella cohnii]AST91962.1 hypothetical protein BC6307_12100 [Sutcliffiella cohnii]